jgi:anhydro-N-acetylmuramic acid kinase
VILGVCCGDALDDVQAVAVQLTGQGRDLRATVLAERCFPLAEPLRRAIDAVRAQHAQGFTARTYLTAHRDLTALYARAARAVLDELGRGADDVAAAGCGELSLGFSAPSGPEGRRVRLAMGSAAHVAAATGLATVGGMVETDLAAGGCGGPVGAWADWALLADERLSRAAVHLGGISEVVFIPAGSVPGDVQGWEVGPGTVLLDAVARRMLKHPHDADGSYAARGRPDGQLVHELLNQPCYQPSRRPCRVREELHQLVARLWLLSEKHGCSGADLAASVAEASARAVAEVIESLTERPHEVVLSGGGARNIHLAQRVRTMLSPCSTVSSEKFHLPVQARRAVSYAILADARLQELPAHCHNATGATGPRVLGCLHLP